MMSEWISVKDRLPECDGIVYENGIKGSKLVLVYGVNTEGEKTYGIARYLTDPQDKDWNEWDGIMNGWDEAIYSKITHWMPLPEPPQEVEDESVKV